MTAAIVAGVWLALIVAVVWGWAAFMGPLAREDDA